MRIKVKSPAMIMKTVSLKDGREISIRLMRQEDVEGIWENFNHVVEEGIYLPVYTPVISEWEKQTWYDEMKGQQNVCLVAIDNIRRIKHEIAGQITIEQISWEAAGHVGQLGIIIHHKYRNTGLGYELITAAQELAQMKGKRKLILSTLATNERGVNLYRKCGFQEIGRYKEQYYIQGEYQDEILMECFLDVHMANLNREIFKKNYPDQS